MGERSVILISDGMKYKARLSNDWNIIIVERVDGRWALIGDI